MTDVDLPKTPRSRELRDLRRRSQPRRGLRQVEAALYVGVNATKFDQLVRAGRMPQPKKLDGTLVWDVDQLDLYFEAFPDAQLIPPQPKNSWEP